jgi:hypothetical protein
MGKGHDPQLVAFARRGYDKWRREVRTTDEASSIRRYAAEATRNDEQTFFGLTCAELVEVLGGHG